jgi:adenine-specific DNA-methyltransferase
MDTEGIKYTGSKRQILPVLLELIRPLGVKTVFDGFSGTTRVSQALKQSGYTVIANDTAIYSKIFGQCYLLNQKPADYYQPLIEHLNKIPGKMGWFSHHYGGEPHGERTTQHDGKKKMWQLHNTKKLDAIREEIDNLTADEIEKSVLLTSLILAMDKVDSTVGHHTSYLMKWAPRAYNTMKMGVPRLLIDERSHQVIQEDIFDAIKNIEVDLAYYDPPYGSSNELMPPSRVRYASYYHIWKTVCLNDKPELVGKANRRADASDVVAGSIFEEFRRNEHGRFIVIDAIKKLIENTNAKYIVLSYNNNGRATLEAILEILKELKFKCKAVQMDYKKHVMANMSWTGEWLNTKKGDLSNKEYLFLIDKTHKLSWRDKFSIDKVDIQKPSHTHQPEFTFS